MSSRSNNPLLQKAKLGKPKKPMSKEATQLTHGKVSAKGDTAASCMTFQESPQDSTLSKSLLHQKGEIGRTRPGLIAGASERTHGKVVHKKDTDQASHQMKWEAADTPEHKDRVGRGKSANAATVAMTHGRANVTVDGGTAEALGDWRPNTPQQRKTVHYKIDNTKPFGVASHRDIGVGELMASNANWVDSEASSLASSRASTRPATAAPLSPPPTGASSRPLSGTPPQ